MPHTRTTRPYRTVHHTEVSHWECVVVVDCLRNLLSVRITKKISNGLWIFHPPILLLFSIQISISFPFFWQNCFFLSFFRCCYCRCCCTAQEWCNSLYVSGYSGRGRCYNMDVLSCTATYSSCVCMKRGKRCCWWAMAMLGMQPGLSPLEYLCFAMLCYAMICAPTYSVRT